MYAALQDVPSSTSRASAKRRNRQRSSRENRSWLSASRKIGRRGLVMGSRVRRSARREREDLAASASVPKDRGEGPLEHGPALPRSADPQQTGAFPRGNTSAFGAIGQAERHRRRVE